jgi:hypothetical protein
MSHRLRSALVAGIFLAPFGQVKAASINARSVSLEDVRSAIDSAHDGDTVVVPAGTASWTATLSITKGVTLQGAGNDKSVIVDDIPRPEREEPRRQREPEGPGQRTVEEIRQRQLERQRQQQLQGPRYAQPFAGSRPLRDRAGPQGGLNPGIMRIELTPNQSFRLSGFTFRYGSPATKNGRAIRLSGTCPSIRVDHCHFDQLYTGDNIQISGWLYGVVDHCAFDMRPGGTNSISVSHETWGNQASGWGSWAEPSYFGGEKFIFIEDNIINNLGTGANNGTTDGSRGGRFVVRHNIFNNVTIFYHGTDSGGGGVHYRGTRAVEIYNNTFNSTLPNHPGGQNRGGPLLWHHNVYTGSLKNGMALKIYRIFQGSRQGSGGDWHGAANGSNPWDLNVTEADGVTNKPGHSPYQFLTGKHTGGNTSAILVVENAGWATNQWAGYSVTNTVTGYSGYIASNTSDTITFANASSDSDTVVKFNTGDGFSIHKVLIVLDQPGRGQDLRAGNPANPTPGWPQQKLEPCYSWNNTLNGSNLDFNHNSANDPLRENVDFYNSTPMPGYTPYTYPHPLVTARAKPDRPSKPKDSKPKG